MQLRLRPKNEKRLISRSILIKTSLIALIFFLAIFLLDKINMPVPTKFIKKEISNDKLITIK
tara:strand:- start:1025 stop:1210 length:186 start_codon:yes stop_codon:yes gene_type:complete